MNDRRVDAGHLAGAAGESNETAIANEKLALQGVGFLLAPRRQVGVPQFVAEHQAKLRGFEHCLSDALRLAHWRKYASAWTVSRAT